MVHPRGCGVYNFSPSNLNRDDTGSPKDAVFGGTRRARISSQCLKRAMRTFVREQQLLPSGHLGQRTKRLLEALVQGLQQRGRGADESQRVGEAALGGLGLALKDQNKTQYLLFLGEAEIANLVEVCDRHWETLLATQSTEDGKSGKGKSAKEAKKDAKASLPDEVKKALDRTVADRGAGGDAVDLAFFGRMLADNPKKNVDAACQVAHALSTHTVSREFDFYTAVDDRLPEDTAGADMLGTVEFNSACYYRYLNLDLQLLQANLQKDRELLDKGLQAFLQAAVLAVPSGKQNSFAAHNPPSWIAFCLRQQGGPRNLANAFAKPVRGELVRESLKALKEEWEALDAFYGDGGSNHYWSRHPEEFQCGTAHPDLTALVQATVLGALAALES